MTATTLAFATALVIFTAIVLAGSNPPRPAPVRNRRRRPRPD